MDLAGCHFTYANTSSRGYGLLFAHCDTSDYATVNGSTKSINVFNSRGNRRYFVADSYNDSPISLEVDIVTDDGSALSTANVRNVERWLFNRKNYYKLFVDIIDDCHNESYVTVDGVQKRFYFNCRFVNPIKIYGNGGIVGFNATMECDSYMLWQEAIEKEFTLSNATASASSSITLNIDSDVEDYIYPKITVTMGNVGGDINITNNTDDSTRITSFKALTGNIEFIIDGNTNYISGNNYLKFFNRNFVRLIPGNNTISIVGAVTKIKFEWENRRYL